MPTGELLPKGVRDYLEEEARRHRYLERQLAAVFQQWGFSEVITPSFEFYEQLETGVGRRMLEKAYKFCDSQGRILALRPEMTTPIARVAATSLAAEEGPIRIYYVANVFRVQEQDSGRLHEFYQAGAEILGVPTIQADAEGIALAIQCLEQLGLTGFKVGIGQVAFLKSLLAGTNLTPAEREQVILCLQERNLVSLETVLRESALTEEDKDFLWEILTKNGNGSSKEILTGLLGRVGKEAQRELAQVEELFAALAAYGVLDKVYLDLGIVRNLDYYTGVIFEVYGPGLGRPIGGGGRYDRLLAKFGRSLPATGFALGFPELLSLCQRQGIYPDPPARDFLLVPDPDCYAQALARARELRREGYMVEVELRRVSRAESLKYAKKKGFARVLFLTGEGEIITPLSQPEKPGQDSRLVPFCNADFDPTSICRRSITDKV